MSKILKYKEEDKGDNSSKYSLSFYFLLVYGEGRVPIYKEARAVFRGIVAEQIVRTQCDRWKEVQGKCRSSARRL